VVSFVPLQACITKQNAKETKDNLSGLTIVIGGGIKIELNNHFNT